MDKKLSEYEKLVEETTKKAMNSAYIPKEALKNSSTMTNDTYKKLEYITSGSGLTSEELNQIVDLMEEYGSQCRKEGFEAFRGKAEEQVNKQESGWMSISRIEVLKKIKDIKE